LSIVLPQPTAKVAAAPITARPAPMCFLMVI
jgi:hypothetical protein